MNGAELEVLLAGMLRLWQVPAQIHVMRDGDAVAARITFDERPPVTISWRREAFGIVWRVESEGRRARTYPSVNGLIRDLRERLVPERGSARVLFAGRLESPP